MFFAGNSAAASIAAFLPTIIATFGFSTYTLYRGGLVGGLTVGTLHAANALAQLLTVPPYAVAAVVLFMVCYAADRMQSRGVFVAGASVVGAIGYACVAMFQL